MITDTIRVLISHLKFEGDALARLGATRGVYKCAEPQGENASRYSSRVVGGGLIDFDVGVQWAIVAPGARAMWKLIVVLEPSDTYTVYVWRKADDGEASSGLFGVVMVTARDIYREQLREAVEALYDDACAELTAGNKRRP